MPRIKDFVDTTGGKTWLRKEDSLGRAYTVIKGEGRISDPNGKRWAAAKSHSVTTERLSRGNLGGSEVEKPTDLGAVFGANRTVPVEQFERGSEARLRAAERNRWLGYKFDPNTPDDELEAAKQYVEMKERLRGVKDPDEIERIKRDYNIGGS